MKNEEDSWAQTQITITPQEDGQLREIDDDTITSGPSSLQLVLDPNNVVHEHALIRPQHSQTGDPEEEIKPESKDAGVQTLLHGYPKVQSPTKGVQNKATQTLYISKITPVLRPVSNIIVSLNDKPMPVYKVSKPIQTVVTINEFMDTEAAVKSLEPRKSPVEDASKFVISDNELMYMDIFSILNFIMDRMFWICDPKAPSVPMLDAEVQTNMRFNPLTNRFMIDQESQTVRCGKHSTAQTVRRGAHSGVQTGLSVGPKYSNSHLLSGYQEASCIIGDMNESLQEKLENLSDVKELVNELVKRCEGHLRLPGKEQEVQTLLKVRTHDGSDVVLKKLNMIVVTDPNESKAVAKDIIEELLMKTCWIVGSDARRISKNIAAELVNRAGLIGAKLDSVSHPTARSMEKVLAKRRQKLIEDLKGKCMVNVSTQTDFAGVPEVKNWKLKVCEICPRPSQCVDCLSDDEYESDDDSQKPQHLKSILLRKTPNYVISNVAEKNKHLDLLPSCPPEEATNAMTRNAAVDCNCGDIENIRNKRIHHKECGTSWSIVVDTTFSKAWSACGSSGTKLKDPYHDRSKKSLCSCSTKSQNDIPLPTAQALQILKSTFCSRSACCVDPTPIDINLIRQREAEESRSSEPKCHGCKTCHKDRKT